MNKEKGRQRVRAVGSLLAVSTVLGVPCEAQIVPSLTKPVVSYASEDTVLVYRGPSGPAPNGWDCDDCSTVLAAAIEKVAPTMNVEYVGPNEPISVRQGLKDPHAKIIAYPGGGEDVAGTYKTFVASDRDAIRTFIRDGGRYLGSCMGAYLAGEPGLGLLQGPDGKRPWDTDTEMTQQDAEVQDARRGYVQVDWQGKQREVYFQDGTEIEIDTQKSDVKDIDVLARYAATNDIAAVVVPFGKGWVGLQGPHTEASREWSDRISAPHVDNLPLFKELFDATMHGKSQIK
jgi:glutamine amidotransferase-like uncharacterized protein